MIFETLAHPGVFLCVPERQLIRCPHHLRLPVRSRSFKPNWRRCVRNWLPFVPSVISCAACLPTCSLPKCNCAPSSPTRRPSLRLSRPSVSRPARNWSISSARPSSLAFQRHPPPKPRGRPSGHVGNGRARPTRVDQIQTIPAGDTCPDCGTAFTACHACRRCLARVHQEGARSENCAWLNASCVQPCIRSIALCVRQRISPERIVLPRGHADRSPLQQSLVDQRAQAQLPTLKKQRPRIYMLMPEAISIGSAGPLPRISLPTILLPLNAGR
jgi:hypothetical protein